MQSYEKYKKYKLKYLRMKKNILQYGGNKPVLQNIDRINRFRAETDMEKFLNPIYGLYTCENGFIENNYYLYDAQHTDVDKKEIFERYPKSQKIHNIVRDVLGVLRPNIEISEASARDIGRYIGLLYFNKHLKHKAIETTSKGVNINFILVTKMKLNALSRKLNEEEQCILNRADKDIKLLTSYITKNKLLKAQFLFSPSPKDELLDFHILLYCLWWNLDDDNGIDEYYKGINEVFTICNRYVVDEKNKLVILNKEQEIQESFESILIKITRSDFHIYDFGYAKHFCKNDSKDPKDSKNTYPDCGETTLRNFINLLCYDGQKFDTRILAKYGAVNELIEYYTTYNNFVEQSVIEHKDGSLNARDKWSELIIKNSNKNNNVSLKKKCLNQYGKPEYEYEVRSLMSKDIQVTNLFQVIMNLFKSVKKWTDFLINNKYITYIDSNVNMTGVGTITIIRLDKKYEIECKDGHYYMKLITPKDNDINFKHIENAMQKEIILLLLNKSILTERNCFYRKWTSESICDTLNNYRFNHKMREQLLELTFTKMFDSDTRRRILIDAGSSLYTVIKQMVKKYKENSNVYDFTYMCMNFDFILDLPPSKTLPKHIFVFRDTETIDLTPLRHIEHIDDNFLSDFINISKIDLSPLVNIKSIGNFFLNNCKNLNNVNLTPLNKITSIGHGFLPYCSNITHIDLTPLENVEHIGDYFLTACSGLLEIDLKPLKNIRHFGKSFMHNCHSLRSIEISPLPVIQSIGNDFLNGCWTLQNIDLSSLSEIQQINNGFLENCFELRRIRFPIFSNLILIGNDFMKECREIEHIQLTGLNNLETIGDNFMESCKKLKNIELPEISKLQKIGSNFLYECFELENIVLPIFQNVKSIEDRFMSECNNIQNIQLKELNNLETIGSNFICKCVKLTNIKLSGLNNLKTIDSGFLQGCSKLKTIELPQCPELKSIKNNFMMGCIEIESVNLSGLNNLETIGGAFMTQCTKLTKIDLQKMTKLKSIDYSFLQYCKELENVQFPILSNLVSIGHFFMTNCVKIQNIQLRGLNKLETIGSFFMHNCNRLHRIELLETYNLKCISHDFLLECSNLERIIFPILSNLILIENNFMKECIKIENVQLLGLNNIEIIGDGFMEECKNLKNIELSEMSKLQKIGEYFMARCPEIRNIHLKGLNNLETIGARFADSCTNLEIIDLSSAIKLDFKNIAEFAENCPKVKILKPKLE